MIREIIDENSAEAILSIQLGRSGHEDRPRWVHNPQGTLTVKSAYLFDQKHRFVAVGGLDAVEWKRIWRIKAQHRLKLFFWKLVAEALPLRHRINFGIQCRNLLVCYVPSVMLMKRLANIYFLAAGIVPICGGQVRGGLTRQPLLINRSPIGCILF